MRRPLVLRPTIRRSSNRPITPSLPSGASTQASSLQMQPCIAGLHADWITSKLDHSFWVLQPLVFCSLNDTQQTWAFEFPTKPAVWFLEPRCLLPADAHNKHLSACPRTRDCLCAWECLCIRKVTARWSGKVTCRIFFFFFTSMEMKGLWSTQKKKSPERRRATGMQELWKTRVCPDDIQRGSQAGSFSQWGLCIVGEAELMEELFTGRLTKHSSQMMDCYCEKQ